MTPPRFDPVIAAITTVACPHPIYRRGHTYPSGLVGCGLCGFVWLWPLCGPA